MGERGLPEKRVLLRLLARRRDRRYRDEDMFLAMIVVEDQIHEAGAGALARREAWGRRGVYRSKEVDWKDGGYRYKLGVNEDARREIDRTSLMTSLEGNDWDAMTATVNTILVPAVNLAINVTYFGYEKRDYIAAKLWRARKELRAAVTRARGTED